MSANMQCVNVNGGCGSRVRQDRRGRTMKEVIVGGGVEGKVDSKKLCFGHLFQDLPRRSFNIK
jgi:hypothetical protein